MFNNSRIEFISNIPGLTGIEECVPKPIQKYIPDWWKKTPTKKTVHSIDNTSFGNIKICPSFADYFSHGFVIPMWTDTYLYYDDEQDIYRWRTASDEFKWEYHSNNQYLDDVAHKFMGKDSYFVFKILCPWNVVTQKGYALYQLPTFYEFHEDFSVVPGVLDASVDNELNIQLLIHSTKKEIFIPRGTPLAHYIPFKKEKMEYAIREQNEKDKFRFNVSKLHVKTQFSALDDHRKRVKRIYEE
jgi:hypothetical protein